MGGLLVATALTLLFLPALYAAWFRVKQPAAKPALVTAPARSPTFGDRRGVTQGRSTVIENGPALAAAWAIASFTSSRPKHLAWWLSRDSSRHGPARSAGESTRASTSTGRGW